MHRAGYRPTFRPARPRRRLLRRLTPLFWVCAGLAALAIAGAVSLMAQRR